MTQARPLQPGEMTKNAMRYLFETGWDMRAPDKVLWLALIRRPNLNDDFNGSDGLARIAELEPSTAAGYARIRLRSNRDWEIGKFQRTGANSIDWTKDTDSPEAIKSIPKKFTNFGKVVWPQVAAWFLATTEDNSGELRQWGLLPRPEDVMPNGSAILVEVLISFSR